MDWNVKVGRLIAFRLLVLRATVTTTAARSITTATTATTTTTTATTALDLTTTLDLAHNFFFVLQTLKKLCRD